MNRRTLTLVVLPLLWCLTLASATGAVYCKHRARTMFIELERLAAERDRLEIEWGQLQLEQSAWSTHAFVERVAGTKLRMSIPASASVRIVRDRDSR
jgi:cell division protein FtsL